LVPEAERRRADERRRDGEDDQRADDGEDDRQGQMPMR
jgi:hypothetical protein